VLHFGDRLYSVAFRILRDASRAEDAVQQTLLTAWRELRRLRDDDRLEAWLYRLLVNACYADARHTRRGQPGLRLITDPDVGPATDDSHLTIELRDQLERAFRRLTAEQRAVLVMHHYVGLSGAEIADGAWRFAGHCALAVALRPTGDACGSRGRRPINRRRRVVATIV
jgi:RNA polymerase sigma-70 factor (ECF subfamily)